MTKINLAKEEIKLLWLAAGEELLYYQRCVVKRGTYTPGNTSQSDIKWQPGNDKLGENAPSKGMTEMEKRLQEAVNKNIIAYGELERKLHNLDTDFTPTQIQELRNMIHDMPLQFDKHVVCKMQIDNTVSFRYVNKLVDIAFDSAKKMMLQTFRDIENKLTGVAPN